MKKKIWVGIDVSKEWIDVAVVDKRGSSKKDAVRFGNDPMDFAFMVKYLEQEYSVKGKQIMFGFENTGRYSLPLVEFFSEYGYSFTEQPGLEIKLSQGMQRGTNDQLAAKQIALYIYRRREEALIKNILPAHLHGLKDLLAQRKRLKKIEHALMVANKDLKRISISTTDQVIAQYNDELLHKIQADIQYFEAKISELIKKHEDIYNNYKLVTSVKGIGPTITAYLLVYTNNFKRFDNWRSFANYIGTAPHSKDSGKKKGKAKVSKMGCKIIKSLLTNGARSAILYDPQIRAFVKRKEREGKITRQIENAVKNKLLARAFAVIKRQTPYVELMAA